MKKLISLIIFVVFVFSLCGCKGTKDTDEGHNHIHTENIATTEHNAEDDVPGSDVVVETQTPTSDIPVQTQAPQVNTDGGSQYVDTDGHYKQNHINKIDVPCAEELEKAQSGAVKKTIYDKYAEEWQKVSDRYYKELLNVNGSVPASENYNTAEQMHEFLELYKQAWEQSFEQRSEVFTNQIIEGADNTGVELMYAQLKYESNRELALFFIGIYEDIEAFSNQGY